MLDFLATVPIIRRIEPTPQPVRESLRQLFQSMIVALAKARTLSLTGWISGTPHIHSQKFFNDVRHHCSVLNRSIIFEHCRLAELTLLPQLPVPRSSFESELLARLGRLETVLTTNRSLQGVQAMETNPAIEYTRAWPARPPTVTGENTFITQSTLTRPFRKVSAYVSADTEFYIGECAPPYSLEAPGLEHFSCQTSVSAGENRLNQERDKEVGINV
jgi:hypothetical protein